MTRVSLFAAAAGLLTSMVAGASSPSDRDGALLTPPPYPANRAEDVRRPETGRLWVSRFPIGNRTPLGELRPGAAQYGGTPADDRWIYVRMGPTALPVDPWSDYSSCGLPGLEAARNQWLRDNGYVLQVRTHVNARFAGGQSSRSMYGQALPTPRATIRLDDELPRRPSRLRVDAGGVGVGPVSSLPIARIVKPDGAPSTAPILVLPEAGGETASASN